MQTRRGIKRIELDHAGFLPRLDPPAGYVVILEDVEFGRYRFMRTPTVDLPRIESGAEFPFEVTVALIFQADNAAAAELDLRDQFVSRADIGDWFDLDASQRADLDQIGHPEPVTLRHLALPESETSSLLRDSKIVSTKPQSRTRVVPREGKRPLRGLRTLLLIVLLAAITAFVAYLGHLFVLDQDLLSALLPASATATNTARPPRPTVVIPTATAAESDSPTKAPTGIEGIGEVFYTAVRARARSCTTRDCYTLEMLEPGTKIESLGYYLGQRIDGSDRWIRFFRAGSYLYVHSSTLSPTPPPTAEPSTMPPPTETALPLATQIPTSTDSPTLSQPPTIADTAASEPTSTSTSPTPSADVSETYIVETRDNLRARVRNCPRTSCDILGHLDPGDELRSTAIVVGETVNGSNEWVQFLLDDQTAYIHSSLLASTS